MDDRVSLRRAGAADAEALTLIARAAYGKYVPRIGREPAPMLTDYAQLVDATRVWLAEDGGRPVGFLVTRPEPGCLLVEIVAVSPAEQGRGIGACLLERAELDAIEADRDEIRLYTNEAMTENLAYYPRHGYRETHRATEDGYRRVFFSKSLQRSPRGTRPHLDRPA
ncbi:GNAT family N-acetyltransferase [Diaminobutyricibacter sp. McL0618]|uniref:GNAT family N-acetyltransferase n=1 Tax=Leifsonia sp. McL0618 TaxID=3415677 RepID=UPI003CF7854E